MKDITEIFGEIIAGLTFQFNCLTVTAVDDKFILTTCNTYWIRPITKKITIGGKLYDVVAIDIDKSITVKPIGHNDIPGTGNIFTIPAPTYRHGTAKAINAELGRLKQKEKTPLVWLYELFDETVNTDDESTIGLSSPLRVFLFDEADTANMLTEDHYKNVIRPLKNLASEIVNYINNKPGKYQEVKSYKVTGLPDWGEFNGNGNERKIFDENWSGLELKFELQINKETLCC